MSRMGKTLGMMAIGVGPMLMAAAAVAEADEIRQARATKRVPPERAVGGLTVEQQVERQAALRASLTAELPDGATERGIRVELTDQDRAALDVPPTSGVPLRIGVVKPIEPRVEVARGIGFEHGTMRQTRDGFVWALNVSSPGAQAIRVHLVDVSLPRNTELYFYSPDGVVDGPYTDRGRNNNGDFWTRSVSSDTGIIQLHYTGKATRAARRAISLTISELGHIQGRSPQQSNTASHDTWPCSDNASCLVDANCVSVSQVNAAKDAVAKMEWVSGAFINTCTGGLIADTDTGSQIPYFLTANHCFNSSISNLETFFFYTTDSCNGTCPDSSVTGGTPPPASTVGITVQATNSDSDYTLATLDEAPPAGSAFLGWNNSPVANTNGASLYRISNANFGPQVYSQHDVDTGSPTCSGIPRGDWIYSLDITGATMGGSSGSPVLNSSGEVVGQLTGCCGFNCGDVCDSGNNWTIDGALAAYYTEVEQFLDPDVGCSGDAECDDGDVCNGSETCVSGNCQSGTPLDCNDGDACTADSCDPVSGCSNTAISCDDGDLCTIDSCDSGSGCVNDPVSCPVGEACDPATGLCEPQVCDNDGTCESGEDCTNCSNDCISGSSSGATCGNGLCEAGDGEDCVSCPDDCRGVQNGRPANRFCCGDGDGQNPLPCSDSTCNSNGWSCTDTPSGGGTSYCCGDGTCEGEEDSSNCSIDCGAGAVCGDGTCDAGEDQCNCATDCGSPPASETDCSDGVDNDCDGATDGDDSDCATGGCGDGVCEGGGEDCFSCPSDCRCAGPSCSACCGDGVCAGPGESSGNCPVDCG